MHIKLFRALKSASVSDEDAEEVVQAIEEYLAVKIKEANAGLEAQLKGLEAQNSARFTGVEAQQKATNWLLGSLGTVIAIGVLVSALSPIITKMVH